MNGEDRRLLASIALVIIGILFHMYYIMYDSYFFNPPLYDQMRLIIFVMTLFMLIGLVGIFWFGFVRDLIVKHEEE